MQVEKATAQSRASKAYRDRLESAGIKRFEVIAPAQDRGLLRALAATLSRGGEDAARLRSEIDEILDGARPERGGVLAALRRAPPEAAELALDRVDLELRPLLVVTKHLLDTNIVSEVFRPEPSPACLRWLGDQIDAELFVSAFTIAEIRLGVIVAPAGRKRRALETWFHGEHGPPAVFRGRILPFDERVALVWAELVSAGQLAGTPRSRTDMIIAATALANGCVIATANERHFEGVAPMINPLRAESRG